MATNPETQAYLRKIQERMAKQDPGIMNLDPASDTDATTIMTLGLLFAALKDGDNVMITVEDEDGHTEELELQPIGTSTDDMPVVIASISSSDGQLAPETSELVASLMAGGFKDEASQPTDE